MPHRTLAGRVLLVVVCCTAAVLVWSTLVLRDATHAIAALDPQTVVNRESSMISFLKEWDSAECGEVVVFTVCGLDYNGSPIPGETVAQCLARHRAQVAYLMGECPPA
jgi:hypothetical protein